MAGPIGFGKKVAAAIKSVDGERVGDRQLTISKKELTSMFQDYRSSIWNRATAKGLESQANLGITAIWFEKGQFDYVEGMLRLARNELRYRGIVQGHQQSPIENIKNGTEKKPGLGLMRKLKELLFGA